LSALPFEKELYIVRTQNIHIGDTMGIIECLWGACLIDQTILILIIVGAAVGGLILGLLLGFAGKSGSSGKKEVIREIHYKEKP